MNRTYQSRKGMAGFVAGLIVMLAVFGLYLLRSANVAQAAVDQEESMAYPEKPVNVVVTFPPGGGTDLLARKLAAQLEREWGQSWVVENRPGASGNIGARMVASAPADGYTLLMVNSSFAVNPSVFSQLEFDPKNDFNAVVNVAYVPSVLVTAAAGPWHSLHDVWQASQTEQGVHFASCGNGTPQHLAGGLLQQLGATQLLHVPYKGCGPALSDVLTGHVPVGMVTLSSASAFIEAGRLRALAVTSPERHHALPDVPSVAEALGQPYELDQWHGLLAPAGTPKAVIEKLNTRLNVILRRPDMQADLEALGYTIAQQSAQEFQRLIVSDIDRFADLSAGMGLQAQ